MAALKHMMLAFVVMAFVSGCSSIVHRNQMASFNAAYTAGDYESALQAVSFKVDEGEPVDSETHLLELLHQGEMYRLTGRYEESTKAYDLAEEGMKYLNTEGVLESTSEGFMSVVINDSERDYEALMSEAVLVNTYKGLAFLAAGNSDYARIEFNRANERTRRAVDYFQKEISEQQSALKKKRELTEARLPWCATAFRMMIFKGRFPIIMAKRLTGLFTPILSFLRALICMASTFWQTRQAAATMSVQPRRLSAWLR